MKITAAIALLIAVAVAGPAPASAATERNPSPDCGAKGSRTLVASSDARVYLVKARDTVYVCAQRSNRRVEIGAHQECGAPRVHDYRFGKGVLGFLTHSCSLDSGRRGITVIDLKTLRTLRKTTAVTASFPEEYSTRVTAWALKPNGSVAWIGQAFAAPTTDDPSVLNPKYQVWKAGAGDPAGGTLLDSGNDIEPGSLALSARPEKSTGESTLYWRKGSMPLSSTLR